MKVVSGIHHITAITGNPQANVDFYEGFLGQRMVKRTVNFDDPRSYHFYFGDAYGKPGTLLTFFYWPGISQGSRGVGEVSRIAYAIPNTSKGFWMARAKEFHISCEEEESGFGETRLSLPDPDGLIIDLVLTGAKPTVDHWEVCPIPQEHMLLGFYGATGTVLNAEDMQPILKGIGYSELEKSGTHTRFKAEGERAIFFDLFEAPDLPPARQGSGSVHHIAFRATTDADELELRTQIEGVQMHPTPVIDRNYFHSVYFMTPGRILFEIATDAPGFAIDEDKEHLGEKLVLPVQFEPHRVEIEKMLVPITLPRKRS